MNAQAENIKHDKFWLIIGAITLALVTALVLVKKSEEDKYNPIKELQDEEAAQMNIRVLNDY